MNGRRNICFKVSSDGEILRKRQHNIFHDGSGIFEERFLVKPECKPTESTLESEKGMGHISLSRKLDCMFSYSQLP